LVCTATSLSGFALKLATSFFGFKKIGFIELYNALQMFFGKAFWIIIPLQNTTNSSGIGNTGILEEIHRLFLFALF
jgi:hypothetical protein